MDPERGVAQVRLTGSRQWVGQAFAVDRRHLLTCAHVVNRALGRQVEEPEEPGTADLLLDFPMGGAADDWPVRSAVVAGWLPGAGHTFERHDVALLRLREDLPAAAAVLHPVDVRQRGEVMMTGPVKDREHPVLVRARWMGRVGAARRQIDEIGDGAFRVGPGFSGGPVWTVASGQVVGMLQAGAVAGPKPADVYALGVEVLAQVWPSLGAGGAEPGPGGRPGPDPDPAEGATVVSGPDRGEGSGPPVGVGSGWRSWLVHRQLVAVSLVFAGAAGGLAAVIGVDLPGGPAAVGAGTGLLVHAAGVVAGSLTPRAGSAGRAAPAGSAPVPGNRDAAEAPPVPRRAAG